jgi:hypothetical protein
VVLAPQEGQATREREPAFINSSKAFPHFAQVNS